MTIPPDVLAICEAEWLSVGGAGNHHADVHVESFIQHSRANYDPATGVNAEWIGVSAREVLAEIHARNGVGSEPKPIDLKATADALLASIDALSTPHDGVAPDMGRADAVKRVLGMHRVRFATDARWTAGMFEQLAGMVSA